MNPSFVFKIERLFEFLSFTFNPDTELTEGEYIPDDLATIFQNEGYSFSSESLVQGSGQGKQWKKHWFVKDFLHFQSYALVQFTEFPTRWWVYKAEETDLESNRFIKACSKNSFDGVRIYQTLNDPVLSTQLLAQLPSQVDITFQGQNISFSISNLLSNSTKRVIFNYYPKVSF